MRRIKNAEQNQRNELLMKKKKWVSEMNKYELREWLKKQAIEEDEREKFILDKAHEIKAEALQLCKRYVHKEIVQKCILELLMEGHCATLDKETSTYVTEEVSEICEELKIHVYENKFAYIDKANLRILSMTRGKYETTTDAIRKSKTEKTVNRLLRKYQDFVELPYKYDHVEYGGGRYYKQERGL